MTHTYHIQGMTCNGCKDSVTRAFQSLEGVHQVHVDLEKGTALLTTASVLQTKLLDVRHYPRQNNSHPLLFLAENEIS